MRILLVEDDAALGDAVSDQLLFSGHQVEWARSCAAAQDALMQDWHDAVLLDLRLPDGHGLDVLRAMRRRGDQRATIILTARDQISDRIAGLDAGADDYLVKPFDMQELLARLNAVARRCLGLGPTLLLGGAVSLDPQARRAKADGREVVLTAREWALMELLLVRPGTMVPRARIELALTTAGSDFESNAVEVYVSRIRKKLGAGVIATQRGLGYRCEP